MGREIYYFLFLYYHFLTKKKTTIIESLTWSQNIVDFDNYVRDADTSLNRIVIRYTLYTPFLSLVKFTRTIGSNRSTKREAHYDTAINAYDPITAVRTMLSLNRKLRDLQILQVEWEKFFSKWRIQKDNAFDRHWQINIYLV